jgi:hypothetical protein
MTTQSLPQPPADSLPYAPTNTPALRLTESDAEYTTQPRPAAIPHYGKSFLTPLQAAEHAEFVVQCVRFHPCPDCDGGKHTLSRCRRCQGRAFYLPTAVARKWGLEAFLLTTEAERIRQAEEIEGFFLAGTWSTPEVPEADVLAVAAEVTERATYEEDPNSYPALKAAGRLERYPHIIPTSDATHDEREIEATEQAWAREAGGVA